MSFLARLFTRQPDPVEEWRPLWRAVVREARDPAWYRSGGVADTVEGRYDMLTLVLALVMLRLEADRDDAAPATARLTELFAEDMEGQLREQGIGDPTVGRKIAALMESLNGRIGAYRAGLADGSPVLIEALRRNVTLADPDAAETLNAQVQTLHARLAATDGAALRQGEVAA